MRCMIRLASFSAFFLFTMNCVFAVYFSVELLRTSLGSDSPKIRAGMCSAPAALSSVLVAFLASPSLSSPFLSACFCYLVYLFAY